MRNHQAATLCNIRARERASIPGLARVIAVTGGKGGVGKSTIAVNLAALAAEQGGRPLALDGDLGMADLNLLLGVAPGRSVLDVVNGVAIEDVLVEAHGVSLLPALNGSYLLANLRSEARDRVFAALGDLAGRFDRMFIDVAAGIGEVAVALAGAATDVIIVTSPEPLAVADAYSCLKVLTLREGLRRALVLPNAVASPAQGEEVFAQLRALADRFLDVELVELPAIPWDPLVSSAAASGVPLVLLCPDTPASRALRQVGRRLDALSACAPLARPLARTAGGLR